MKNKGFTLVELISIVAVLAVLAIMTFPIIQNVLSDSKAANAQNSCKGYIESFEDSLIGDQLDGPIPKDGLYYVKDIDLKGKAKGDLPTDGWLYVVNGEVKKAEIKVNDIVVEYDGTHTTANKNKTEVSEYEG